MRLRVHSSADGHTAIITLSRRNLLALLAKLDLEGSARTIFSEYDCPEGWTLVVQAEDDDEYYAGREEPPGPMHPATERPITKAAPEGGRAVLVGGRLTDKDYAHEHFAGDEDGENSGMEARANGDEIAHGRRDPGHEVGVILQSTLHQGTYWWDRRARRHEIERMPLDYLLNLMSFLERRVAEFWLSEVGIELCEVLSRTHDRSQEGSVAAYDDPVDWLHATPLFRGLRRAADSQARVDEDEKRGGE